MIINIARPAYLAALCSMIGCSSDGPTQPHPQDVALGARRGHVMVYDEARHQLILFGGVGPEGDAASADRGSTWAWTGTRWSRLTTTGPSPRHHAVAVYDASRQRVVLFGGRAGEFPSEQVLNDTWEWNGTTWTRVADGGPTARVHLSMAFDRSRGRVVLYGGFSLATMTELRDIWEWNGSSWSQASVTGPPNTIARGAAFDEKTGALVLFSVTEATPSTVLMDVWNGTTLSRLPTPAPECLQLPTSLGATRGGFVSAGSCGPTSVFRTDVWNGASWIQIAGTQPSPRGSHAMAYDRDRDRVVLFGGETLPNGSNLGDMWEFNGTSWSSISLTALRIY